MAINPALVRAFPEVVDPNERRYVHAYWRYLLGWQGYTLATNIPISRRLALRSLVRAHVNKPIVPTGRVLEWPSKLAP